MEIEIENVDKTGAFIGNLFVKGDNLAVTLLNKGYASVHEYSANESRYGNQFFAAERNAKQGRHGLWKDYQPSHDEEQAAISDNKNTQVAPQPRHEYIDIVISDMISGSHFYIQTINPTEIKQLETLMKDLTIYYKSRSDPASKPRVGDIVSAKFTEDDCWYRAKVRRISSEGVEVLYIDYGNVSRSHGWHIVNLIFH